MLTLNTILTFLNNVMGYFKKHPKFFIGVISALIIVFLFRQCEKNAELKTRIDTLEVEIDAETERFKQNLRVLGDSIRYYDRTLVYSQTLLQATEEELELMSKELDSVKKKFNESGVEVKTLFVTEVESSTTNTDLNTKILIDTNRVFAVNLTGTNRLYTLNAQTWLKATQDSTTLSIEPISYFGEGKPTKIDLDFNFKLALSTSDTDSGTKVYIKVLDAQNNEIPKELINIPYAQGVNFVEVSNKNTPIVESKNRRFSVVVGPTYGVFNNNGTFQNGAGLGIMVGYRLW
jgi:hypothetical protein